MKTKALMSLTSFFMAASIFSQPVFAGSVSCDLEQDRCSQSPLKPADADKSIFLADQVNDELEKLYQANLALGKDTKVVLIARRGQNTKKFKILKDNGAKETLQDLVQRLQAESKVIIEEKNRYSDSSPQYYPSDYIDGQAFENNYDKEDKLKYSHLGIAFRNKVLVSPEDQKTPITGPGTGKWTFYHLLYSCDKPQGLEEQGEYIKKSHIFKGTVHSFFYDHLNAYTAQVIVPTQEIQNNLEDMILNKRKAYSFQEDHYNAAAKFQDLSQQNSNQFVLEAVAAAMRPEGQVLSRAAAISVLRETGYGASKITPTGLMSVLKIGWIQKMVSGMMPTMCLKTQPDLKEYGIAEIVTSNSVLNWMKRNNLVDQVFETGLDKKLEEELESLNKKPDDNNQASYRRH
jgi:hypothetical protein